MWVIVVWLCTAVEVGSGAYVCRGGGGLFANAVVCPKKGRKRRGVSAVLLCVCACAVGRPVLICGVGQIGVFLFGLRD